MMYSDMLDVAARTERFNLQATTALATTTTDCNYNNNAQHVVKNRVL